MMREFMVFRSLCPSVSPCFSCLIACGVGEGAVLVGAYLADGFFEEVEEYLFHFHCVDLYVLCIANQVLCLCCIFRFLHSTQHTTHTCYTHARTHTHTHTQSLHLRNQTYSGSEDIIKRHVCLQSGLKVVLASLKVVVLASLC